MKKESFKNKAVVVTGAANGIGRAISMAFGAQGAKVLMLDEDVETGTWLVKKLKAKGKQVEFFKTDLSREAEISAAARQILELAPRLAAVVNNAGISQFTPLDKADSSQNWSKVMAVNLSAPYFCVKYLLPGLQGGAVVNIASTRALMSEPNTEAYSASKGGILALTHALAISLQGQRVRVNAICPGWIDVSGWHGKKASPAKLRPIDHQQHPAGRVGKPEDIAEACLFLCDPAKAGFITGANFVIDGGMTKKMIYEE